MERRAPVFKKKKTKERKKERKEKKVPVPREWVAACIDGWARLCIVTERSSDLQKSIPTKQTHHLQNRHRNKTFFFFTLLLAQLKKKTAAQALSSRGTGRAELNVARRCMPDRHPCSCSELSSSRKISVLPMSQLCRLL